MADKSIEQLIAAEKVNATDLFVLQQSGTAKKLTGQVLENWLLSFADGHGGIQSITKLSSSGLVDTYRITLADNTTFDFVVTNGRSIDSITQISVSGLTRTYRIAFNDGSSQTFAVTDGRSITGISKTSTSGLVDTYTITYNNGTTSKFTVTNGAKGDKGDNAYVWIKYASQEPTESSHSMGDIPDNWIGIYSGNSATAPSDWKQYKWYKVKGEKGDTGVPATLVSKSVTYQVGDSGSIIPSGTWVSSVPVVPQGKYLWAKTEIQFNSGDPIVSYSVARMGMDGSGSVSSVNNVSPDDTGNVTLTADNVGALAVSGGDMEGTINMNGQPISGLNPPTENTHAANKGYVDTAVRKAAPRNLLDNSDFTNLIAQAGYMGTHGEAVYFADRWFKTAHTPSYDPVTRTITFNPAGLSIIDQKVASDISGKTVTFAVKAKNITGTVNLSDVNAQSGHANIPIHDGITTYTFVGGQNTFARIYSGNGGSCVIDWAALYEGEYTAETLPGYHPKGYAAELLECQRYYWKTRNTDYIRAIPGIMTSATKARFSIPLPTNMRTAPTVSMNFNNFSIYPGGLQISNIGEVVLDGTFVLLGLTTSGGTINAICILRCVDAIELSADL